MQFLRYLLNSYVLLPYKFCYIQICLFPRTNRSLGAGCDHEFCTRCALYLCSTNCSTIVARGPLGSIACPLCRNGIVSFVKLLKTRPMVKGMARTSLSLSFCSCAAEEPETSSSITTPLCKPIFRHSRKSSLAYFRSQSFQKFPSIKINYSLCMGGVSNITPCLVPCSARRCSRSGFRRTTSQPEGRSSWLSALNQQVLTGSGCWIIFFFRLPFVFFFSFGLFFLNAFPSHF